MLACVSTAPVSESLEGDAPAVVSTALVLWSEENLLEAKSLSMMSILAACGIIIFILLMVKPKGREVQQPAQPAQPWMNLQLHLPPAIPNIHPPIQPNGSLHEIRPFQMVPTAEQVLVAINRRLTEQDLIQYVLIVDSLRKIPGWQQTRKPKSIKEYLRSRRKKAWGHLLYDMVAQLYYTDLLFSSPELNEYFLAHAPLMSIRHLQTIIIQPSPLKAIVQGVSLQRPHRGLNFGF